MANIKVLRTAEQGITVRINGQDYSAEAFEATEIAELGILCHEAREVAEKIEALRNEE